MAALLEATDLSFGYTPAVRIFEDFAFSIGPGEVVALTGPSGTGKSTLLYILGLIRSPDKGRIRIDGQDVPLRNDRKLARIRAHHMGFVFQDSQLDPTRTVIDNIVETSLYRGHARRNALPVAEALMEHFGVSLRGDHKPGQISGGQAQRVALCRALLGTPTILLADEPTGNLDDDSAEVVIDAMWNVAERSGATIVATHDPRLVERCSRRIQL